MTRNRQYAVLGLGVFGSTVATTLTEYGCDVLGVDIDAKCVERVADQLTKSVVADITNRDALEQMGIGGFDVVVIGIADHFEQAILATLLVKELGVKYVIVKAKNRQNMQILERIGADRVIRIEKETGERLAKSLLRRNIVDLVEIDDEHSIVEIMPPQAWVNHSIIELDIRNQYDMNILGVKESGNRKVTLNINPNYVINENDALLVLSSKDSLDRLDTVK